MIELNNVTKKYGDIVAVNNLTLSIPQGSIYGFVGPNGAGKTTTIKMILGLTKPTEGTITVNGQNVGYGKAQTRHIGYLPDVPGFYEWMNAKEYLLFCGALLKLDKNISSAKADELLTLTGLSGIGTKIRGYSRGMKQRLGLAQALIGDPNIILMDEPASALDPVGRKEMMDLIKSLKGKVTVLFSSHIISDVERVCDTILIMNKGVLKVNKSIAELEKDSNHIINVSVEETGEKLSLFINELSSRDYVSSVKIEDNGSIGLTIKDIFSAGKDIPRIISESSLTLKN